MNILNFEDNLNIAIIGASGGIGGAFVNLLVRQSNVDRVFCFSRSALDFDHPKVTAHPFDIASEDSVESAAKSVGDKALDVVIVATGVLHTDAITPEKSLRDLRMDQFEDVFAVNSFGPALVMKHFAPKLPRDRKGVLACLSARVGSIEDNRLGGWYTYRASKAALNMLIKTASIEVARRYKQACIIGLHPGTVDTDLSKPFQGNVPDGKLFTPDHSAACLLRVINDVQAEHSGKVLDWDGQIVPY